MDKILTFKNKYEEINLEELNATAKLKNADGKHIVEPQRVYADTLELLEKHNITYNMLPIHCQGGKNALYNEDLEPYVGKHNIKAYTMLRTSGIITFPQYETKEDTMQIRLDITEKGITMSTGKLVLICTNGMTAFRGDILSTYGNGKLQYEQALGLVENWITGMEDKSKKYDNLITGLKSIPVQKDAINNMIGKLLYQAVDGNNNNIVAPLNVSQVSAFTGAYIEKDNDAEIKSAWDLYNLGTDLIKHDKMDMIIVAERNYRFTDFMLKDVGLGVEDAQVMF
jgi:hypothetical protein